MTHFPWDIVVLAVLSVLVACVLVRVLGHRMGVQGMRQTPPLVSGAGHTAHRENAVTEPQPPPLPGDRPGQLSAETGPLTDYVLPEAGSPLAQRLADVALRVPGFSTEAFLRQAEGVFRNVATDFACGNNDALKACMTPELFEVFEKAIDHRLSLGHKARCEVRSVERIEVKDVESHTEGVCLKVGIVSWQISHESNAEGVLVAGTEALTEFRDLWSFVHSCVEGDTWRLAGTALL